MGAGGFGSHPAGPSWQRFLPFNKRRDARNERLPALTSHPMSPLSDAGAKSKEDKISELLSRQNH